MRDRSKNSAYPAPVASSCLRALCSRLSLMTQAEPLGVPYFWAAAKHHRCVCADVASAMCRVPSTLMLLSTTHINHMKGDQGRSAPFPVRTNSNSDTLCPFSDGPVVLTTRTQARSRQNPDPMRPRTGGEVRKGCEGREETPTARRGCEMVAKALWQGHTRVQGGPR